MRKIIQRVLLFIIILMGYIVFNIAQNDSISDHNVINKISDKAKYSIEQSKARDQKLGLQKSEDYYIEKLKLQSKAELLHELDKERLPIKLKKYKLLQAKVLKNQSELRELKQLYSDEVFVEEMLALLEQKNNKFTLNSEGVRFEAVGYMLSTIRHLKENKNYSVLAQIEKYLLTENFHEKQPKKLRQSLAYNKKRIYQELFITHPKLASRVKRKSTGTILEKIYP